MKNYIKLIRPKQWTKNLFVMLPLFFSGSLLDTTDLLSSILTFFAFCFVASSIYCLNDVIDMEADRRHPVKCNRPIASGRISVAKAYLLMGLLLVMAMLTLLLGASILEAPLGIQNQMFSVAMVMMSYWLLNLAYCTKLKEYAIIDVCVIAFGFVLRIVAGGLATDVVLSHWLVLMTFLLTLFLSFCKRRDDVLRMNETGEAPRKNTIRYNLTFINQVITVTGSITLVCYIMYTVSPEVTARFHTQYLYLTTVFVLLGLFRYLQIAVVDKKSGDPTKVILRDHFIQLVVVGWVLTFLLIIYIL